MALLEREHELAQLDEALRAARAGAGTTLLIEGPPGIGKTALVAEGLARARRARVRVISARCSELETAFAYGVVRQLFEPVLAGAAPRERRRWLAGAAAGARAIVDPRAPAPPTIDQAGLPHALYWLIANLVAEAPMLLAIDDAHWCDQTSLGALVYLARRVEGLPLVLVLARRPVEPGTDASLLDRVGGRSITPAALSEAAVGALTGKSAAVSHAVHASTGGNPLYVLELVRVLDVTGEPIPGIGPRSVAEITLARLARMSNAAQRAARAIAILEPVATLHHVGELAGLDAEQVVRAADELHAAAMLDEIAPCRFAHPIVRAAIENDMLPARRGCDHARAAVILRDAGAPLSLVAAQLVHSTPAADPESVALLVRAAGEASRRGAPAEACTYLVRALAEPPDRDARSSVLFALGVAEALLQRSACVEHLREAHGLAKDPEIATRIAVALGHALTFAGELDAAFELLAGLDVTGAGDAALDRDAALLMVAMPAGGVPRTEAIAARHRGSLAPTSPSASRVLGAITFRAMIACEPRDEVLALAERSLFDGALTLEFAGDGPALVMIWLDELDRADQLLSGGIAAALESGYLDVVAAFATSRAYCAVRRGDLRRVDSDLDHASAACGDRETSFAQLASLIARVLAHVERGEAAMALRLLAEAAIPPPAERTPMIALLRHAEGLALAAERRFEDAVRVLTRVGDTFTRAGVISPTVASWRSDLALAHARCGRVDQARELVETELRLAERAGIARARGRALRALALLERGERQIELLAEAAEILGRTPAVLEHARALCDLGAALRRTNHRRDARERLQSALELAHRSGAQALADHAFDELAASGARPRRFSIAGVDALTGAELRVCQLAREGLSNQEIAQQLLVTRKTVEAHLGSAYRKLEIDGREQLAQKMPGPGVKMPSGS